MAEFGKLNFSVAFNPTSAFPLDARTYFESLADAQEAARQAKEVGSSETVYYYGMELRVVENGVATAYIIQPDNTLLAIGSGGSGGTSDHRQLTNRDSQDQHPMESITGLSEKFVDMETHIDETVDTTLEESAITNSEVDAIWNNIMNS